MDRKFEKMLVYNEICGEPVKFVYDKKSEKTIIIPPCCSLKILLCGGGGGGGGSLFQNPINNGNTKLHIYSSGGGGGGSGNSFSHIYPKSHHKTTLGIVVGGGGIRGIGRNVQTLDDNLISNGKDGDDTIISINDQVYKAVGGKGGKYGNVDKENKFIGGNGGNGKFGGGGGGAYHIGGNGGIGLNMNGFSGENYENSSYESQIIKGGNGAYLKTNLEHIDNYGIGTIKQISNLIVGYVGGGGGGGGNSGGKGGYCGPFPGGDGLNPGDGGGGGAGFNLVSENGAYSRP